MGYGMIHRLALLIEHDIGEVVVFVDDEIKRYSQIMCGIVDKIELGAGRIGL